MLLLLQEGDLIEASLFTAFRWNSLVLDLGQDLMIFLEQLQVLIADASTGLDTHRLLLWSLRATIVSYISILAWLI